MALKKPKKPTKAEVKATAIARSKFLESLPSNRGEWLELVIKITKKAMHNPPLESEKYLLDQIDRLNLELKEWRKNESKNKKTTSRRGRT